jgi:hypothetical protein
MDDWHMERQLSSKYDACVWQKGREEGRKERGWGGGRNKGSNDRLKDESTE